MALDARSRREAIANTAAAAADRCCAVIEYGSGTRDVDLLLVLRDGPFQAIEDGVVDCLVVSEAELALRCEWRDIAFTEPVIGGVLRHGTADVISNARRWIHESRIPVELLSRYSRGRAVVELKMAEAILAQAATLEKALELGSADPQVLSPIVGELDPTRYLAPFTDTLAYALTYWLVSERSARDRVVTFAELQRESEDLRRIRAMHPGRGERFQHSVAQALVDSLGDQLRMP